MYVCVPKALMCLLFEIHQYYWHTSVPDRLTFRKTHIMMAVVMENDLNTY